MVTAASFDALAGHALTPWMRREQADLKNRKDVMCCFMLAWNSTVLHILRCTAEHSDAVQVMGTDMKRHFQILSSFQVTMNSHPHTSHSEHLLSPNPAYAHTVDSVTGTAS